MRQLRPLLILAAALVTTLATMAVQRFGPDHGIYCAIGKINGVEVYCPKPKLNSGWPAPYLFDVPGISVEGALFIVEDDFRWGPFVADWAFFALGLLALVRGWERVRR